MNKLRGRIGKCQRNRSGRRLSLNSLEYVPFIYVAKTHALIPNLFFCLCLPPLQLIHSRSIELKVFFFAFPIYPFFRGQSHLPPTSPCPFSLSSLVLPTPTPPFFPLSRIRTNLPFSLLPYSYFIVGGERERDGGGGSQFAFNGSV